MMEVIRAVCAAFGPLTVSEVKTAIMCLRTKGMPDSTASFTVEAAGKVHNQMNEFVYFGGMSTTMPTCPSRSIEASAPHGAASGRNTLTVRPTERSPRDQNPDA